MKDIIYLDNNGTTHMTDDVKHALAVDIRGNASSTGIYGERAHNIMEKCKNITANHFNIDQDRYQIVFTSGASESNNSIIRSTVTMHNKLHKLKDIPIVISTLYEHKTTSECLKNLEDLGECKVIKLKPNEKGLIEPYDLEHMLKYLSHVGYMPRVCLVSIMHVNNEIGSKNAIYELGKLCKRFKVPFHSDICQSMKFTHVNMDLVDAISASYHKISGPKGSGLLIFNKRIFPNFMPLICGNQQDGYRGGTENVNMIFASSVALLNTIHERELKNLRLEIMRNEMIKIMSSYFDTYYYHELEKYKDDLDLVKPYAIIFGPRNLSWRNPNTIYFAISGGKSEQMNKFNNDIVVKALNDRRIIISKGSTCNTRTLKPGGALKAINASECLMKRSFRISLGDENLEYQEDTINAMHDICNTILNLIYASKNYHMYTFGKIV